MHKLHRSKLSAVLPCEVKSLVCQRISYLVIGYLPSVECRQLVFPIAVSVGIRCRIGRRNAAQTAPCQRICLYGQNVAAVVSLSLSPPPQAVHRIAAARSRHGSDSPPDCHSLPCRHCATLESFKGRLWRVSVFLLPQSLARQLPRRRSPHLTINLSNFTQTPQSRTSRDSVSLRLGHVAALTVHRTVIHYRADTALPYRGAHVGAVHGCGTLDLRSLESDYTQPCTAL